MKTNQIYLYEIIKTMDPLSYHDNGGFVATNAPVCMATHCWCQ